VLVRALVSILVHLLLALVSLLAGVAVARSVSRSIPCVKLIPNHSFVVGQPYQERSRERHKREEDSWERHKQEEDSQEQRSPEGTQDNREARYKNDEFRLHATLRLLTG
jgi:hypothetical protein